MSRKLLLIFLFIPLAAKADLRKDPDSRKIAGEAARYIMKDKRVGSAIFDKLKDNNMCTRELHKGCFFWKKGSNIWFQRLSSQGKKEGPIFELEKWVQKVAK